VAGAVDAETTATLAGVGITQPPPKKRRVDLAAAAADLDRLYSFSLWSKPVVPENWDTYEGFKKIINAEVAPVQSDSQGQVALCAKAALWLRVEYSNEKCMMGWPTYIGNHLNMDLLPRFATPELFIDTLSGPWRMIASHVGGVLVEGGNVFETRKSTQKLDHIVKWDNVVVFAGEHTTENSTSVENLATKDLINKFHNTWNGVVMNGLPYLPAYTACGKFLRFYLLQPKPDNTLAMKAVDENAFECSVPEHRVQILHRALNLAFVFKLLCSYAYRPPTSLSSIVAGDTTTPLVTITRVPPGSVTVYLDWVEKKCVPASDAVYAAVASIPGSITIQRERRPGDNLTTIVTRPVHAQVMPLTFKQLMKALRSIICFLRAFHELGFTHRDIRWPNIVRTYQGKWILIDFELAGDASVSPPDDTVLDAVKRPPEARGLNPTYSTAGDIWQVGMLIKEWLAHRGAKGFPEEFQRVQLQPMLTEEAAQRPTAEQVLELLAQYV
jgi:serine/threonine protein kinase